MGEVNANEILVKSAEMFMRYGIRSVTLDELSSQLAISKKTIYQHFENKDQLVLELTKMMLNGHENQICQLEKESENVIDAIMDMSKFMRDNVSSMNPAFMFDLKKYYPEAYREFRDFKKVKMRDHVSRILHQGIKQGMFRKDINVDVMAVVRIEQVEDGFDQEIFPPNEFDMKEVQMQMFMHFVYGICTMKGHELLNKSFQIDEK